MYTQMQTTYQILAYRISSSGHCLALVSCSWHPGRRRDWAASFLLLRRAISDVTYDIQESNPTRRALGSRHVSETRAPGLQGYGRLAWVPREMLGFPHDTNHAMPMWLPTSSYSKRQLQQQMQTRQQVRSLPCASQVALAVT